MKIEANILIWGRKEKNGVMRSFTSYFFCTNKICKNKDILLLTAPTQLFKN